MDEFGNSIENAVKEAKAPVEPLLLFVRNSIGHALDKEAHAPLESTFISLGIGIHKFWRRRHLKTMKIIVDV
jgi:hypothetical protein